MKDNLFSINNFNVVQDEENYYFFRALNFSDEADIEQGFTVSKNGRIIRIRTDRERYDGEAHYRKTDTMTLKEFFDHIKTHHRADTNCISFTSNANVSLDYGRRVYNDNYVMIRVPKRELGAKVVVAGQYMLTEVERIINNAVQGLEEIEEIFQKIDSENTESGLKQIIETRYTAPIGSVSLGKAHPRKGIGYRRTHSVIGKYQALSDEQMIEVNRIYAKLSILEREGILSSVIEHTSNTLLREAIGNAFSSTEIIHYGEVEEDEIVQVPREIVDIFSLIQQIDDSTVNLKLLNELKSKLLIAFQRGDKIPQLREISGKLKSLSIEEMYELTDGRIEYGIASDIVRKMFYLSKSRENGRRLAEILRQILNNDSRFEPIIQYIQNNTFRIEPEIVSRKSGKGIKISESVSLDLKDEELLKIIRSLSSEELDEIIRSGGLNNVRDIILKVFNRNLRKKPITKEEYYAEAIMSQYDWEKIGIKEFRIEERNELLKRLKEKGSMEIYQSLERLDLERFGIDESKKVIILLNIIMRQGLYEEYLNGKLEELLQKRSDILQSDINVEIVERFLGYYDREDSEIKLKDYQEKAHNNVNRIFESKKFAQVILPTGGGKSFVALVQMLEYKKEHPDEKMLYLAPNDAILSQIKAYIKKYIYGAKGVVGKTDDEIVAEVFPNLTLETYTGLLFKRGQEVVKSKWGFIVVDETQSTGANESGKKIDELFSNQGENVRVLGITATPVRDSDGRNMADELARKLGYMEEAIENGEHIALNMTLETAIRMGYVVNPKVVYCTYSLVLSGRLAELESEIEDISDETIKQQKKKEFQRIQEEIFDEIDSQIGTEAREELVKKGRERYEESLELGEDEESILEQQEEIDLLNSIGIENILIQYIKKGGKYITFLPTTNQNGMKAENGEERIEQYRSFLEKVFSGTDIAPQFNSMFYGYSEEQNKQELENFQAMDLENDITKFMLVFNMANAGLHGISGMTNVGSVILRRLGKYSISLYLQIIGRVIFALDEDNPISEEQIPIILDLMNNFLTVRMRKEFKKTYTIDDIEVLSDIIDWINNNNNGLLPDIDSDNKQERYFYANLRRIQQKYIKYLDEEIPAEEKRRIEKVLELGEEIDLWGIDLPEVEKSKRVEREATPFYVEGILKDLIDLEEEVDEIKEKTVIAEFIEIAEKLINEGIDVGNFPCSRKITEMGKTKRLYYYTLQDLVNMRKIDEEIIERLELDRDYQIGYYITIAKNAYKGTVRSPITDEEKRKLEQLGIVSLEEKKTVIAEFIEIAEKLSNEEIDVGRFPSSRSKKENGKTIQFYNTLQDLVDMGKIDEEIIERLELDKKYQIGHYITIAKNAYKGTGRSPITDEEKGKLEELGIIGRLDQSKKKQCEAKQRNGAAKKLEEEIAEAVRKRKKGKNHEE